MTLTADQQQMVADNLGLVGYTLRTRFRITREHTYYDDLWQEGVFGLIRAVQKFDPAKSRLSTYAVIWINQSLQRGWEHIEGRNYASAHRRGVEYKAPLSIDWETDEGATYGDMHLVADTDVETDALDDTDRLAGELYGLARDDIDRAVIHEAVTAPYEPGYVRDKAVAASHGITVESSRRRRRSLAARYYEQVA